jgi:hypothetical protein
MIPPGCPAAIVSREFSVVSAVSLPFNHFSVQAVSASRAKVASQCSPM